ncbi:MAG: aminopeptidase, partial [Planctomycetales bacterium]|nr:aminopeptidase [Planctomycetales bacterium]
MDPRLDKLADVLVNYSTQVQPGNLVRISGSAVSRPLLVAIYRKVLAAGGHPLVNMTPDECQVYRLLEASDEQLRFEDPLQLHEVEKLDVAIHVWG